MRTSNHMAGLLGWLLILTVLPLCSLFAQEKDAELKTFLDQATEEIPNKPKRLSVTHNKPSNDGVRAVLQNVTEEIPHQPKPRFVSSNSYSDNDLKIQLGYFKEKKNVSKMVNKIRNNYDWSVYVKTENNNGTDYYRVMIVDIASIGTANEIIGQLKSNGVKAILK